MPALRTLKLEIKCRTDSINMRDWSQERAVTDFLGGPAEGIQTPATTHIEKVLGLSHERFSVYEQGDRDYEQAIPGYEETGDRFDLDTWLNLHPNNRIVYHAHLTSEPYSWYGLELVPQWAGELDIDDLVREYRSEHEVARREKYRAEAAARREARSLGCICV